MLTVASAAELDVDVEKVNRVYVVRRPLNRQPLSGIGVYAHSALLLETDQGRFYVLEYHRDSKAHLTSVEQKVIVENERRGVAAVRMSGWANSKVSAFLWERQLIGDPVPDHWTPTQLQQKMQELMKSYSLLKQEHCHTAQERLRLQLGLPRSNTRIATGSSARREVINDGTK